MNIKAIIRTVIFAACNDEWGYDREYALDLLKGIDPDRDWAYELFEGELEEGYRHMGPNPPTSAEARACLEMYGPVLLKMLQQDNLLFKSIEKDGFTVTDKRRSFITFPISYGPADGPSGFEK